ncbi:MAG: nucleotidyltransferase domain-containing protein [Pseudomonadota bacterium]
MEEFVSSVERAYGARLRGIHLFGSRARGNARPDSDYDVAVVLNDLGDFWTEKMRLADIAYDQLLARDIHVQAHPFGLNEWTAKDREDLVRSAQLVAVELTA